MRNLVSGLTAGLCALLIGTLIAGAAESARAAEAEKQQVAQAIVADTPAEQATVDAGAYRAQLQQATARLSAAYADLQARDAAYRELLATSQANTDRLQAANRQLQEQVAQASARLQAQAQRASTTTAALRHEERDDDD